MRDNLGADIEARRAKTDVQLLLRSRYAELGKMTGHEYAVLALFLLLVAPVAAASMLAMRMRRATDKPL